MELQTSITWTLYLGDKRLAINENLLENLRDNKSGNEKTPDFDIPQLLQDVYYVDQLSISEGNKPNEKLILQDQAFNFVRAFHILIKELLENRVNHIFKDNVLEDMFYDKLRYKKGIVFDKIVDNYLSEPFSFRSEAYKIFSLLPNKYKSQLSKYSRWDIVAFPDEFAKYWDNGLSAIVTMHNDIYNDDILSLKEKLKQLSSSSKFNDYYLNEKKGCFSKTEVIKNGEQEDILCFSGVNIASYETAINAIVNSGHFQNPIGITKSDKVRYYICPGQYITYADAMSSKEEFFNRMFSCCERKTFAEYDWQGVTSYTMIVKYPPCELCQFPVWTHSKEYNGRVNHEIKHERTDRKIKYDAIARIIYKKIHDR